MTPLAAIHVARKKLGLDEETYRAVLVRVTGKSSAGEMSEAERTAVVGELRRQGFSPASKGLEGPFAKKLQALWIAGWNLGVVDNRDDAALLAFVKRQTGIDHTRFLLDGREAAKAIDALKAWLAREAGVDWTRRLNGAPWADTHGGRIAWAQWELLIASGAADGSFGAFKAWVEDHAFNPLNRLTPKEWQGVMNRLGERVRKSRARRKAATTAVPSVEDA